MARRHSIALFGVVCGLLAGCAGSASSPPKYVVLGSAICGEQLAELHKLAQPITPQQALFYLPRAAAIMRRETGRLAALDPPASKRAEFVAALANKRQLAALLSRVLHQLRGGMVELGIFTQVQTQGNALTAAIDTHFRQAGLPRCVE